MTADLDNNGAADLIVAGPSAAYVFLRGPERTILAARSARAHRRRAAADVDDDGRLELVGRASRRPPATARSTGERRYHWQTIRTHAATSTGDQRINSFGVGGEIEVRTGLHLQKELITGPVVHVGLGEAAPATWCGSPGPTAHCSRSSTWAAMRRLPPTQRLKGSCPWLFAWNGQTMGFVTDVLWRSPLGLRINAQATADVLMTEDWVKASRGPTAAA